MRGREQAATCGDISTKTYNREHDIIEKILIPAFAIPFKDIRRIDIVEFVERRKSAVRPATLRKEARILKAIIDDALDWEIISLTPYARIRLPKIERPRQIHFTWNQFRSVLLECPKWLRPIVVLANATGLRRSNVLGLTPSQIDLDEPAWHVPKTKNGDGIDISLTGIALAAIRVLLANHTGSLDDVVFPGITGNRASVEFKLACR